MESWSNVDKFYSQSRELKLQYNFSMETAGGLGRGVWGRRKRGLLPVERNQLELMGRGGQYEGSRNRTKNILTLGL